MRNAMRLLGFVAAAAFVIVTAMPASANCNPNKTASTFIVGSSYWTVPPGTNEATLSGQFWQQGNRAAGNEGLCSVGGAPVACAGAGGPWLYFYQGKLNMNAVLGSAEVAGCPTGTLITTVGATSGDGKEAYFLAGTVAEISGPAVDFAYSAFGDRPLVAIPRPRVLSQSKAPNQVTLHINVPSAAGGVFGPGASTAITGYRLVSGNGVGTTDAGRDGVAYTTLQTLPGPAADVTQIIDCTGIVAPNDKFVGVQLVFSDNQVSKVSGTYRVGCDPALASPKAPIVPKKGPVRQLGQN
jgi:hypothetical protein